MGKSCTERWWYFIGKLTEARFTFEKPTRTVERVFVHHTASDNSTLESVRKLHVQQNGWVAIGYHFLIDAEGAVEVGRSIERIPAAQGKGFNGGTIAVALHGALHEHPPTEAQLTTLIDLCEQMNAAYNGNITFHGHKEVKNTKCPGFDYVAALGLDSTGHIRA